MSLHEVPVHICEFVVRSSFQFSSRRLSVMSEPAKSKKKGDTPSRRSPFKREHLLMFRLEIMQSGMDSQHASTMTAIRYLFCMRLGRNSVELVDGRKSQRTQNVKYFSPSFRKDNFTAHVKS
ncbi:unnamed protein product [Sphagnum jensenii]|uniref:Uncharacterized protein n=1 Tax=Sphagnum jensenii TaxID=128206 RepID=A0ABP1B244_9BRYO